MRASHVPETGRVGVIEWPDPVPTRDGEFVVRMDWASICGSDLHAVYDGRLHPQGPSQPGYPGHEGVGEVVESRSSRFRVGDRVLTLPLGQLGGCFAEHQLLDEATALHLPDGAPAQHLMIAQQYGTVLYAMKNFLRGRPPIANGVAVVQGAGSAGLFFVQELFRAGYDTVYCSDLDAGRLAVAAELGARAVRVGDDDLLDAVRDATGGEGADVVVDAVGGADLRNACIDLVRRQGDIGLYGLAAPQVDAWNSHAAFARCAHVHYSVSAQTEPGLASFREALARIAGGQVRVDYCVGPVFDLDGIEDALRCARRAGDGAVKVTVRLAGR